MKYCFFLAVFILSGAISAFAARVYQNDFKIMPDSLHLLDAGQSGTYTFEVRAALSNNTERNGISHEYWGIVWDYIDSQNYYYTFIHCGNSDYGDFLDSRYARVKVGHVSGGVDSVICESRFDREFDTSTGFNSIIVERDAKEMRLFAGAKQYNHIMTIQQILDSRCNSRMCGIVSNDVLNVQSLVFDGKEDITRKLKTGWYGHGQELDEYLLISTDSVEGYWAYLDRVNDDTKARLGGRYRLALVKSREITGGYDIIYVSGAETNADMWQTGMLKGRIFNTIFENHYNVEWYDSMLEIMNTESHADIEQNAILSIRFPLFGTTLRFFKEKAR